MCRKFAKKSSFHGVKVKPILSWLVIELLFTPNLPAEANTHAFMNAQDFVVLAVVPLPRDHFAASVRKPLALTRNACVVADVGVTFVDNLIGIGIDFDAAHAHIKTVCSVAPKPCHAPFVRAPSVSARVPLPAMVVPVKAVKRRLEPPQPIG